MSKFVSSISGLPISAQSAAYAPTNSAVVSAIASAYAEPKLDATASAGFYPSGNPSGFITGVDLSEYATTATVESAVSGKMDQSAGSSFYGADNPSGFITGVDLSDYATTSMVDSAVSGKFDASASGEFYPSGNPSGFLTSAYSPSFDYNTANQITAIDGSALGGMDEGAVSAIASAYAESAASAKMDASESSAFYPATSNPSGYLTAQAQASWTESASASPSYIQDKPDLVDIVAGPGIVVDNPDGNTLRVTNVGFPISETDAVRCGTFKNDPMFMKTYTFTGTVGTSETIINMTIDEKKGTGGVNRIWIDPSNSFVLYGSAGNNVLPISWRLASGRQGSVGVLGANNGTLSCRCVDTSSTPLTFNITIRFTVSNS